MTILDTPARNAASTVINKFGKTITYIAPPGAASWDSETGRTTVPEPVSYEIKTVLKSVSSKLVDGTVVTFMDVEAIVAAADLEVEPQMLGQLVIDGKKKQIVRIEKYMSGALPAAYSIVVKR